MQCTNCHFQNMPGSQVCGRCGTSLGLATAVIDVHPPRAGKFSKRLRRVTPRMRSYYHARDAVAVATGRSSQAFSQMLPSLPPLPLTLRMILPGWSQLYAGLRVRGHLFLWSFLAFLIAGLIWFGTTWGSIFLGLAFSIHSSALLDLLSQDLPQRELRTRMARGLIISVLLAAMIYWPAGWMLSRAADAVTIEEYLPPFLNQGDVLLVNRWRGPRPGRIVLYSLPIFRDPMPRGGHGHTVWIFQGDHIDRILAGPGDSVRWEDGQVFVNDRPCEWLPVTPLGNHGKAAFRVPADSCFILPSTTIGVHGPPDSPLWQVLSTVPLQNIQGQVYFRTHPFSRFGRVH